MTEDDRKLVEFFKGAARYFRRRPTGGEDAAHWANVYNAQKCDKAAARITELSEQLEAKDDRALWESNQHDKFKSLELERRLQLLKIAQLVGISEHWTESEKLTELSAMIERGQIVARTALAKSQAEVERLQQLLARHEKEHEHE